MEEIFLQDEVDMVSVGDIICTCDSGFVPKAIRIFMRKYRKQKGLPLRPTYNHIACCIENDGDILIAESAIKGAQAKYTPAEYFKKRPKYQVMTWKEPLTDTEKELFSDTAMSFMLNPTRYDFKNFIDQMRMIIFGAWKGKTGEKSKKKLYCSEMAAVCMDKVRGSFGGVTWDKNPTSVEFCADLKKL